MSKVLDILRDMKTLIALWLVSCALAVIILAITMILYPAGLPKNDSDPFVAFAAVSFLAFFGLSILGVPILAYSFFQKSKKNFTLINAKKNRDIDALVNALRSSDSATRSEAAMALGELKDPRAIEPLIDLLRFEPSVWATVAMALQNYGEAVAGPLLEKLAAKPNITFDTSISPKRPVDINLAGSSIAAEGWPMAITYGPQTIRSLIKPMGSCDSAVQAKAYTMVKAFGSQAEQPLLDAMDSEDPAIRAKAIGLLCEFMDPDFLDYFIRAAKDSNDDVRQAAIRALGMSGDLKAVPALNDALNDGSPEVRKIAASGLEKIKAQATAPESSPSDFTWPADYIPIPEVVKEKEIIIKEIVKIPCRYCGTLVDVTSTKCPICGAPFSR